LSVEFNAAALTADFALETFDFGAPFRDLRVDLVERTAAFREFRFAVVDFPASRTFFFADPLDLGTAINELTLKFLELFSRVMSVEDLQICQ
jgi:hypothetical protein